MKNIYLIYIFLFISGCGYNLSSNSQTTKLSCPSILFGSGHTVYIGSSNDEISLSNVEYQGEINNAIFSRDCLLKNNIFSSELSILFIMKPFIDEVDFIDMPFYVAILNQNKELQDILYFSAKGKFKKNLETKKSIETDIIKTITLKHQNINENSIIIIGYILDKKRKKILN